MNLSRVKSDLDRREPIFTVPSLIPEELDGQIPAAHIWSGLSRAGDDRYLPVLFDYTDSDITPEFFARYGKFSMTDDSERNVRPVIYKESRSVPDPITMELSHQIKPVNESEVDNNVESPIDVRDAAREWKQRYSKGVTHHRIRREYGFLYKLDLRIYGAKFSALFPIFAGSPSESMLRKGLREIKIPCVAIVPDHIDTSGDSKNLKTRIEPMIISG
ncbi:hypothetical protein [Halorubrum distributum]|uniref:hypothetical protein n=1 Tax=Halorubrum distributum TaxID=29283 RepID=UPI001375C809|nr:hypothetical protein [Halorubrum arcis]